MLFGIQEEKINSQTTNTNTQTQKQKKKVVLWIFFKKCPFPLILFNHSLAFLQTDLVYLFIQFIPHSYLKWTPKAAQTLSPKVIVSSLFGKVCVSHVSIISSRNFLQMLQSAPRIKINTTHGHKLVLYSLLFASLPARIAKWWGQMLLSPHLLP